MCERARRVPVDVVWIWREPSTHTLRRRTFRLRGVEVPPYTTFIKLCLTVARDARDERWDFIVCARRPFPAYDTEGWGAPPRPSTCLAVVRHLAPMLQRQAKRLGLAFNP